MKDLKKIGIMTIFLGVGFFVGAAYSGRKHNDFTYEKANKLLEEQKYVAAVTLLETIEDYKDVRVILEETKLKIESNEVVDLGNKLGRMNKAIVSTTQEVLDSYTFNDWQNDDFKTEYPFSSKEELALYSEEELAAVEYDWIESVLNEYVNLVLDELGIEKESTTDGQKKLIGSIRGLVKEELKKRIDSEWNSINKK